MKTIKNNKNIIAMMFLSFLSSIAWAQSSPAVEVNGNDVGSWFSHYWIWIAGVVLILILILLFSGGFTKKTTTVVTDSFGDVKKITTTESEV